LHYCVLVCIRIIYIFFKLLAMDTYRFATWTLVNSMDS
jgi:hypothetical protein